MYNEIEVNGYGANYYIDRLIDKLQSNLWTDNDYKAYGKVEVIEGKPYIVSNNEYTEVLLDDRHGASSFFHITGDYEITPPHFSVNIDIVFQIQESKFHDKIRNNGIYSLQFDAIDAIKASPFNITNIIDSIQTYENFDTENITDAMAPFYLFKIQTTLFANLKL